jgi:hypothetical protein
MEFAEPLVAFVRGLGVREVSRMIEIAILSKGFTMADPPKIRHVVKPPYPSVTLKPTT